MKKIVIVISILALLVGCTATYQCYPAPDGKICDLEKVEFTQ